MQEVVGTSRVEARGKNGRESNKVDDGWGQESWKRQRKRQRNERRGEVTGSNKMVCGRRVFGLPRVMRRLRSCRGLVVEVFRR